jgi:type IV pilus assembly protein PilC
LVAAVRSAEMTGRLDTVLEQAGRYMERDLDARRRVSAALTYPGIILVLSVVTVVVLSVVVLPRFTAFFGSFDAELPLTTRVLISISSFMGTWWWVVGLIALVSVTAFVALVRSERGRHAVHRLVLRAPVVGRIVRYALAERFCRMLSAMISAGVPLPEGMIATAEGTGNIVYRDGLMRAREEMIRGDGFARPIARTGLFPGAINQMVRVGEDTGSLDEQLEAAASFYELELDFSIKRMTTLFEPAAIIAMALVVGFVALAIVQAMYGVLNRAGAV